MRQHLPSIHTYASASLCSPVFYSILFLFHADCDPLNWFYNPLMGRDSQPSLGMVNKRYTPHSVMDTAIWPLHPTLQDMGVQMWPQNPSQHSDPGSYSPLLGVRIREENYLLISLFWSKDLIWQMQKLRLRRKKWFVQGHTARLWES